MNSLAALRRWLPKGQLLAPEVWAARHRAIVLILWLHVAGVPAFAIFRRSTLLHAVVETTPLMAAAIVASLRSPPRPIRSLAATFGLMSASAVLVHLSGGVIEMHFHFFVMVPLVVLYQDWVPFLLAIVYVLVHHGVMGALYPESVYNHAAAIDGPWKWAAIHALFVSGASAVCLVTWRMSERARVEVEHARSRLSVLADAGLALSSSLELESTLARLVDVLVPRAFAGCRVELAGNAGLRTAAERFDRLRSDDAAASERVFRSGEFESVELDGGTAALVPLIARDEMLGVLTTVSVADADPTGTGAEDLFLTLELGRRLSAAIESARLYQREHSVAETLQRSLLPESFPTIPGLGVAARYAPGGPGVDVGGDWYDLFDLPNGNIAVVMGDVVGRGVPAASLMGQLRNALRAYAGDGYGPAAILRKLHRLVQDHDPDHLATLVIAELDLASGELKYANAGHPGPLVVDASSAVEALSEGVGVPLGAVPHATFTELRAEIPFGSSILFFTDGLVEDRSVSLSEGIDRVRTALASAPLDLEALCDHVLTAATTGRDIDDDVALLVVRLEALGNPMVLDVPGDVRELISTRAALRRWLVQAGANDDECYEILVAAGEACTNAIEHAGAPGGGGFRLEARLSGTEVTITVTDRGTWRPKRAGPGGRGLHVMQSFMDDVEVVRHPAGTEVRLVRSLDRMALVR